MANKFGKKAKGVVDSVIHPPYLRAHIPAQQAKPAPPLGPQLAKRNINIANFCKDFNERTKDIKEGTPLPCDIRINPDRSYQLDIHHPPANYLIRLAAGCKKGSDNQSTEVCGKVTLKHIYEIAQVKRQDPALHTLPLETVCKLMIAQAHTVGIEVVRELSAEEYAHFLEEREQFLVEKKRLLDEKKQAKIMRTV